MRLAAVLVSLGLHAALVLLLVLSASPPEIKPEIFEVSVQKAPEKKRTGFRAAGIKSAPAHARGNQLLFPEFSAYSASQKIISGTFADSRSYETSLNGTFGDDGNKNWSFNREVFQRIDSALVFDSLLAQYGHFGKVFVQFKVTEEGILKLDGLKASSNDAILKVHVLRALSASLKEPFELTKFSKSAGVMFQAQFDFSFGAAENNFDKQKSFGKPVFVFRRTTEEKPVPQELVDQLLSGGASPNISLMIERWQKYNKKKHLKAVEFDPFESYRRDKFYQL